MSPAEGTHDLRRYRAGCRCDICRAANNAYHTGLRRNRRNRLASASVQHGKAQTYSNWGCRCARCGAAWSEQLKKQRKSRLSRSAQIPHGTLSGYNSWGCRCEKCRACSYAYELANRGQINTRTRRWAHANRPRVNETQRKSKKKMVDKLSDAARSRGNVWTGPELEIVARTDLSVSQQAAMLGRTYYGVMNMRRQLRVNPKVIDLAGVK